MCPPNSKANSVLGNPKISMSRNAEIQNLADALRNVPQEQRKNFYFSSGKLSESYLDSYVQGAKEHDETYEKLKQTATLIPVTVNAELPEITVGSEKQIAWAEKIRRTAIQNQINSLMTMIDGSSDAADRIKIERRPQFMKNVEKATGSKVSTFSQAVNDYLNSDKVKNNAFLYFKNSLSAKEIIDSRDKFGL